MFPQTNEAIKLAMSVEKKLRQKCYQIRESVRSSQEIDVATMARTDALHSYIQKHSIVTDFAGQKVKIGFSKEIHDEGLYLHLCVMSQEFLPWNDLLRLRACFFLDTEEVFHMLPPVRDPMRKNFAMHLWHQIQGAAKQPAMTVEMEPTTPT